MICNLNEAEVNTTDIPYVQWYMHIGSRGRTVEKL